MAPYPQRLEIGSDREPDRRPRSPPISPDLPRSPPISRYGLRRTRPPTGSGRTTDGSGGHSNAFDRLAQPVNNHAADYRSADQFEIGPGLGTAGGAIENYSGPASPGDEPGVISGSVRCKDDPCSGQVEKLIAPVAAATGCGE